MSTGSILKSASRQYILWEPEPAPNRVIEGASARPSRGYTHDDDWEQWSYPLGNGMLGANVFGRTDVERIQLSEKTFANEGLYGEGGLTSAAELYLDIGHDEFSGYRRELRLNDAIQTVSYTSGGIRFHRELFASYPDDVLVVRLTADRAGALSLTVRPEIPHIPARKAANRKTAKTTVDGKDILLAGTIDFFKTRFAVQVRVLHVGGELIAGGETISVRDANEVTLLVGISTNYELRPEVFLREREEKLDPNLDPVLLVADKIRKAQDLGFEASKQRHVADHSELFERVAVNLTPGTSPLPTHQLLEAYQAGDHKACLEELMFQYGRYLIIASSRATTLPAHLQGAWNQHEVAPWTGGYWHNINVQMNYWGANKTDLAETFLAYANYFQAYLPQAQLYAREFLREHRPQQVSEIAEENGWTAGNGANAYQIPPGEMHSGPGTQAFTTLMLMEYYNFTRDEKFLREVAYPAIRMLSQFYAKALVDTDDGFLLVEPSASPEIQLADTGAYYVTRGCTYDQSMVWQNHTDLLRAAQILGIDDDPFLDVVRDQIPRLNPILIGDSEGHGYIKEFREETRYSEFGKPNHRHISQLIGLYPGDFINFSNPEWMEAASRTLDLRGNDATGWAIIHRMLCRARLQEAEKAHELLRKFIVEKTLPNLWSVCPPFQIEASLGVIAGVAEMLLQSNQGFIEILPALPGTWKTGSFDGLIARGNFKVSAQWTDRKLTGLSVLARSGGVCRIKAPGIAGRKVLDPRGQPVAFETEGPDMISLPTKKGMTYFIREW
jgi:alpha-L-fucosidase 2